MVETVRCGLIGYGAWGVHHARAITSVAGACLSAICARTDASAARAKADYPQANVYTDYRKLIESEKLDLCDVVLPSSLHFDVSKLVLESGRDLLLEKPMALTVADCTELLRIARQKNRIIAVGHELRVSSLWGKVKTLIEDGAIGKPLHGLIELWRKPYRLGADGWRYDSSRVGNWILEEPIHFFDLARWYFRQAGEPASIYASGIGSRPDRPDLHDNFTSIVRFAGGQQVTVTQTLSGWEHHQTAKITGDTGAIWANWSGAMDRTFEPTFSMKLRRGDSVETIAINKPSGEVYELVDQVAQVVRAVRDGTPIPCTGEDGWWSTMMCLKALESMESGNAVALPPCPKI